MPAWTDCTMVRTYLKQGTPLTDAELNILCDHAEAFISSILLLPSTFAFDSSKKKHLTLRDAATLRAALLALGSCMTLSEKTLDEAQTTLDLYRDMYNDYAAIFNTQDVSTYIVEEP